MFKIASCNDYIALKKTQRDFHSTYRLPEWSLKELGYMFVRERLKEIAPKTVLEIGPDICTSGSEIAKALGIEYWTVDKHATGLGICSNDKRYRATADKQQSDRYKIFDALLGDDSTKITVSYFDAIFSVSVVEQMDSSIMNSVAAAAHRALKPGGLLVNSIGICWGSKKHYEWHEACLAAGFTIPQPHILEWSFGGNRTTFLERQDISYVAYNSLAGDPWQRGLPYISQFATALHLAQA